MIEAKVIMERLERNIEELKDRDQIQNSIINRMDLALFGDAPRGIKGMIHKQEDQEKSIKEISDTVMIASASFKTSKWLIGTVLVSGFGLVGGFVYFVFAILDHIKH